MFVDEWDQTRLQYLGTRYDRDPCYPAEQSRSWLEKSWKPTGQRGSEWGCPPGLQDDHYRLGPILAGRLLHWDSQWPHLVINQPENGVKSKVGCNQTDWSVQSKSVTCVEQMFFNKVYQVWQKVLQRPAHVPLNPSWLRSPSGASEVPNLP